MLSGVFPDYSAPIVRNASDGVRELAMARWEFPRPYSPSGAATQILGVTKRRDGKSCIPTLNQTFAESPFLKIQNFILLELLEGAGAEKEGAGAEKRGEANPALFCARRGSAFSRGPRRN